MSQFLPSHQLLARSSTNEPDAQIPLVDVNGSPRFVGNLGTASSGRRRDDVDGDRFPSPPGAGSSRTRRHAHRSHPNGSPRGKNRLHAAKKTTPGRRRLLPPLPRRHFPPPAFNAGSHQLCFAPQGPSGPVGHRKPGPARESVAVRPGTKSSWLQFHHPLAVRARDVRCGCGHTHTLSSRRLRPPPPWIKPQPSDGRGGVWRHREPSIGPTTRGRAQPEPSD